ncbi:MAG TPA: nucleotidyl transferase AbiEii/AbiGii toxin family protein [Hanamia sp.]|nr:nucleotidyl transferase AbiEii/AbiGii toxin family protein [Hanamia sp.]
MQKDILSDSQKKLLPLLKRFKKNYYLVGGTAIALYIGHRKSIDFDLFTSSPLNKMKISNEIQKLNLKVQPLYFDADQQHYLINEVKCTFLYYPYPVEHPQLFLDTIYLPSLLDLSAMKAFALGRRSKWKDYVDMYFILKEYYTIKQIIERAKFYFPDQVSEKLFRNQLAFHKDIDYTEEVDFVMDSPPSQKEIKDFLIEVATQPF